MTSARCEWRARCRRTGPCRTRPTTSASLGAAVPAAITDAGVDPAQGDRHRHRLHRVHVLPVLADGTPLCELPGWPAGRTPTPSCGSTTPPSRRPTGSTRSPRAGRDVDRPLRRQDLLGVAVRQGAAAAGRGSGAVRPHGPVDRGGRLDHLAAVRRETRNVCTAGYKGIFQDGTYPSAEYLAALDPRFRPASPTTSSPIRLAARRPGRRADRATRPR